MEHSRRELLVSRIISGSVRIKPYGAGGPTFLCARPAPQFAYAAQELYAEALAEGLAAGLWSDDDLYDYLCDEGLWGDESEALLRGLPKEIEEFKVQLYKANFRSAERKAVRAALDAARARLHELESLRHSQDHLGAAGNAALCRARFLTGMGLRRLDNRPVFATEAEFFDDRSGLVELAVAALSAARIGDAEVRELARTEPWRSVWACRRCEGSVFGMAAAELTDEQRSLAGYSALFDSVYEHPDCPPDAVVEDDDLLDGWLIDQRRQREQRLGQNSAEELVKNEKIRGSQEVYLVADTADEARQVMDLNDPAARRAQRRRFAYLAEKGEVNELDMPDTKQRLRMAVTNKLAQSVRGG